LKIILSSSTLNTHIWTSCSRSFCFSTFTFLFAGTSTLLLTHKEFRYAGNQINKSAAGVLSQVISKAMTTPEPGSPRFHTEGSLAWVDFQPSQLGTCGKRKESYNHAGNHRFPKGCQHVHKEILSGYQQDRHQSSFLI
jgi:hypothetical protein